MLNPESLIAPATTPLKKIWADPELIFITRYDVTITKHSPLVKEHTGAWGPSVGGGTLFYDQSGGAAVTNKLSALS